MKYNTPLCSVASMQRHDNYIYWSLGTSLTRLPLEDLLFLFFKKVEDSVTVYDHCAFNFKVYISLIHSTFSLAFPGMVHFALIDRSFDELTTPSLSIDNHVVRECFSLVYQARPSLTLQKSERGSSRCY